MTKAWILNSENEINQDSYQKNFEVRDKHIEVEHTQGFMRYVWLIGGLLCIVAMKATVDYSGLIIGLLGLGVIWLISKALTTKISKDLHLIFYVERDKKHDDYFAIDLKTNEILYVQHIFADPDDEHPATVYAFENVPLENFKNYVANSSERHYELVKDITPTTQSMLKNIQFGETAWSWAWFAKQKENEKIKVGCFRISIFGDTYAKYVELSEDDYSKHFGRYTKLNDLYKVFMDANSSAFNENNIKCFSKQLLQEEIQTLISIFNGDSRKCETLIEKYFNKEFIAEYEYDGNANVSDVNGMNFLQHLSNEKEGEAFTPATFSNDQIIIETAPEKDSVAKTEQSVTAENETKNVASANVVNQPSDKYKNYGLISLICALGVFITIIPLTWIAGLIYGILSIKHSKELGAKRDGKAVAGVIISSIEAILVVLMIIGMIVGG